MRLSGATLTATIAQDAHYRKENVGQFWGLLTVCFALVNSSSLYRRDCQDPRSFGLAHQSPTPCAGIGRPSLSDGLSPPETQFNPFRSISEPTLPLALHTPQTSHGVAIVGNIVCTRVGKALLAAALPHFRPLTRD